MIDVIQDKEFHTIILGAGISGLVAASVISTVGKNSILIIDEYSKIGGNHISIDIGNYTFDIGSYIFQDDSPLLKHFPEMLPYYVKIDPSWQRLNPQGFVTKYPISIKDDLINAGPVEWARIGGSIIFSRLFRCKMRNARDFARYWIGARFLKRSGLEEYMKRFYGLPPDQIDLKFAMKRMGWISEYASLNNPMLKIKRKTHTGPSNQQLARPRKGFDQLYRVAVDKLARKGVRVALSANIDDIAKFEGRFVVKTDQGSFTAERVISTLPLHATLRACNIPLRNELQSVSLISLFYSFKGARGFTAAILYNFSYEGSWKRLTVYSDFYGRNDGREYFGVEVNADHVGGSIGHADRQFRDHVAANGLFDGDLILEGNHTMANAYPIYVDGATELAEEAVHALSAFGVESIGRQGRFDYQPTARDTTLKAEKALG
jgi:protoporphyrinogen oxidase